MRRLFGKLGFIHRCLWRREALYRAALLFGPAPLLGRVLAGAVWGSVVALRESAYRPPAWAVPQGPDVWDTTAGQPQSVQPARPLPPTGADDKLVGYQPGWQVTTNPIQMSGTGGVDVKPNALTDFTLVGPTVDMAQIIAAGPKTSLYVGIGRGFLAIRTAGVYTLTLRVDRPAGPSVDCLMRLAFGPHRIVSNVQLDLIASFSNTFDAVRFDLQPGLYPIAWAFGCWRDNEVTGPGRMTVLVGHPGDANIAAAHADDIVR